MANQVMIDVINGEIGLNCVNEWLAGKESKVISPNLNRAEFALFILNYVQREANKFLITPKTNTQEPTESFHKTHSNPPPIENSDVKKETDLSKRTPFKLMNTSSLNKTVPTILETCPHIQNIQETFKERSTFGEPCCGNTNDGSRLRTSTPKCQDNSPGSSFSLDSNSRSFGQAPYSGQRVNSSNGYQRSNLHTDNSPSFSPSSPQYADRFPYLGSRGWHRTPQSPSLGDFIKITKPISQKDRKRIKPTQLVTTGLDKKSTSSKGSNIFGTAAHHQFVPIHSPQSEYKELQNYEEERSLIKLKRSQSSNVVMNKSLPISLCSDKIGKDNLKLSKSFYHKTSLINTITPISLCSDKSEDNNSKIEESFNHERSNKNKFSDSSASLPVTSEIPLVQPDLTLVKCFDKVELLASLYCACLNMNFAPNIISELHFIFTILTSNLVLKRHKNGGSITNKCSTKQELKKDSVKRNIDFNDSLLPNGQNILECKQKSVETNKSQKNCDDVYDTECWPTTVLNNNNCSITCDENSDKSCLKLTAKEGDTDGSVLSTVHNCVMFAAIVVENLLSVIQCLDKYVIRLILENSRLVVFRANLIPRLTEILEAKEATDASSLSQKSQKLTNGPILYQTETDSKDNFLSLNGFNVFKKQRDTFYEILREWDERHTDDQWFKKHFPRRVESLLSMSLDPNNMMHLARLFCAQLTSSKVSDEEGGELEIPGIPRDKLSLLKARLSKPTEVNVGPRPSPQFLGHQQFYLHFLKAANGSTFLTHVADCLIHQIYILDHAPIFSDGLSTQESRAMLKRIVSNVCLLGKFLGLVVFAPYAMDVVCGPSPPQYIETQLSARQSTVPPIDIASYLDQSLSSHSLVVTVPWVVAFLGMMDHIAPLLPNYHAPLQLLVQLYVSLPLLNLSQLSLFLLRSSLGWLFDPAFFPVNLFCSLVTSATPLNTKGGERMGVDSQTVVDHALLAEICPGLASLRAVLSNPGEAKRTAARHITPVPALLTLPACPVTPAQTLELKLEESFLNGQSHSFRVTIDFVVDRMSSSCIKYICSHVIAPIKENAINQLKSEQINIGEQEWVHKWCCQIAERVEAVMTEHFRVVLPSVLAPLLGFAKTSTSPELCTTQVICSRRCHNRTINWLNSHLNFKEMFSQLMLSAEAKPSGEQVNSLKEDDKIIERSEAMSSPSNMILTLQGKLCQCIESASGFSSEQEVLDLVKTTTTTLKYCGDVLAKTLIYRMTIDMVIMLLAHKPSMMTVGVTSKLCQLWTTIPVGDYFLRLISPRNAILLCQGGSQVAPHSWTQLSSLLVQLVKSSLVTPAQLEEQWVALLKLEWPRNVLAFFGACLKSMIEKVRKDPVCSCDPKFVLTLEWVGEISNELAVEDLPYDL